MNFWVGVTDNNWFDFLSRQSLDEVNFWQPSAKPLFNSQDLTGMPFLFKLKKPNHHIAGGGFYVGYSTLSLELAWDLFGIKNGASCYEEFVRTISQSHELKTTSDLIGCTILCNPFFLKRDDWIPDPPNWGKSIVRGKTYSTQSDDGLQIWTETLLKINNRSVETDFYEIPDQLNKINLKEKFGYPVLVKPRLGQGSFRMMLMKAYKNRCAITGENTLEVLEAAHIQPFASSGTHDVSNGLLLRADFHKLFDKGLVSVTPDLEIKISPRIREAYFNGKAYYRLDNQKLAVIPDEKILQPDRDKLAEHYETRFQR